jgi:hypothetical protein
VAPVIPPLIGSVTQRTAGQTITLAVHFRFAPGVQLHVTVIQHGTPRRHFLVPIGGQAVKVWYLAEARPKPQRSLTVTIRAWGVYLHHRRTVILTAKLRG